MFGLFDVFSYFAYTVVREQSDSGWKIRGEVVCSVRGPSRQSVARESFALPPSNVRLKNAGHNAGAVRHWRIEHLVRGQ